MSNLTVVLNDDIARLARIRAIQEGTSVSAKVREFLARYATGVQDDELPDAPALPVFQGKGGLKKGIDPCSNKSLLTAAGDE